ncbi:MAG: hypothetical protein LBL58_14460, partial [Tannerellaceae bacterium]|nr:hypothetical protein [Tannerellaceae bacterium]
MKKWTTYIFAAFVLAGCSDEIPDNPKPVIPPQEEGTVVLKIQFPNSGSPNTYAIDDSKENKISNLHVLSFIQNGGGGFLTDTLAYHLFISGDTIDSPGNGQSKSVKTKLKNMVEEQRLVLIANLPLLPAINFTDLRGKTMADIVDKLRFSGSTWRPPVGQTDTTSFPMFGQMTSYLHIHSLNQSLPSDISFNMTRSVAKIDVGIDINGTGDPALGYGTIFKIDTVYVYNSSDSGYIAPHNTNPINIVGNPAITEKRVARITYVFPPSPENRLGNIIYIPESDTLKGNYKPAFLILKGTYYGDDTYYKIDFTNNDKFVPILRNHSYVINIAGVRAPGYATLGEAEAAPVSNLNHSLILDQDDIGLKVVRSFNNEYYLAVNSTNLYVDWMAQEVTVDVKTSFAGGWNASGQSGFTGFTNSSGNAGVLDAVKFNILQPNLTGASKEYTFNIKAGVLTLPITVTQSPGSNSYITRGYPTPMQAVQIPKTSANVDGANRSNAGVAVETLWKYPDNLTLTPQLSGNIITVTPSGLVTSGNGVVALKDASGKILYSWHIWVVNYNNGDPNDPTKQKSNNGFIFMDRDLGADKSGTDETSYGLYYQWGRKDPFTFSGSGSGATPLFGIDTINSYTDNLELAIQHPDTFYAVPYTSPYDWIGSGVNNNLWSTMDGKKGPYDPCPFGWRVPVVKDDLTGSPWYGFSGSSGNGATYPLAGYLNAFSGARDDATEEGGVWGASARGQQAYVY